MVGAGKVFSTLRQASLRGHRDFALGSYEATVSGHMR